MYDLTPNATALQWTGRLHVVHDNSQSLDEMRPTCNTLSDGGEIKYVLHVPTTVGVDGVGLLVMMAHANYAQRHILDTVVYVVEVPKGQTSTVTCLQKNQFPVWEKACSDDANPPGGVGSSIRYMLKPGYSYILAADAYNQHNTGH